MDSQRSIKMFLTIEEYQILLVFMRRYDEMSKYMIDILDIMPRYIQRQERVE
jgi:hypothetical protein